MRTKLFHLAGLLSVALLVFALIVATGTAVSAKGARNTGGDSGERTYGNSSRNDSGSSTSRNDSGSSSSRSNDRSEQKVEQRVEQRTESRHVSAPDPPPTPKYEPRYEPKYQSNRSDSNTSGSSSNSETQRDTNSGTTYGAGNNSNGSPQPHVQTRSETARQSDTRSGNNGNPPQLRSEKNPTPEPRISNRVTERTESRVTELPEIQRSQTHNERNDNPRLPDIRSNSKSPTVFGMFRKEVSDLGRIWKERRERRDNSWDRQNSWQDRGHDQHQSNVHININFFPGRYQHYCYDYDPWNSWPTVYCYYYGLFPPYLRSARIIRGYHSVGAYYSWIEIPITIVFRDRSSYSDDYYLSGSRYGALSDALRDIELAWERSDLDLFARHVLPEAKIDVFLTNKYEYTLDRQDYCDMTRDAMANIKTIDMEFYRIRQRDSRQMVAYGKHTYYDAYSAEGVPGTPSDRNVVYVSYTFEKDGDCWYITEVGSSPDKLD